MNVRMWPLSGHGAIFDWSPKCTAKRTLATAAICRASFAVVARPTLHNERVLDLSSTMRSTS